MSKLSKIAFLVTLSCALPATALAWQGIEPPLEDLLRMPRTEGVCALSREISHYYERTFALQRELTGNLRDRRARLRACRRYFRGLGIPVSRIHNDRDALMVRYYHERLETWIAAASLIHLSDASLDRFICVPGQIRNFGESPRQDTTPHVPCAEMIVAPGASDYSNKRSNAAYMLGFHVHSHAEEVASFCDTWSVPADEDRLENLREHREWLRTQEADDLLRTWGEFLNEDVSEPIVAELAAECAAGAVSQISRASRPANEAIPSDSDEAHTRSDSADPASLPHRSASSRQAL